ncbi:MAG: hypothetical protein V3T83_12645 [Acidobacteriota bacterium]
MSGKTTSVTLKETKRDPLVDSLSSPHRESGVFEQYGFEEWAKSLPEEDCEELVDLEQGTSVEWRPGQGWIERNE